MSSPPQKGQFFSPAKYFVLFDVAKALKMPGVPKSKVKSRIVLTPQHAKRLLKAIQDNVQRFESMHGEIKDYQQATMPINFGPTGEA